MTVDLLFGRAPLTDPPINLVFGGGDGGEQDSLFTLAGTLPALTGEIHVGVAIGFTLGGTLPTLVAAIAAVYDADVSRPLVGRTASNWQVAQPRKNGSQDAFQRAGHEPARTGARWQSGKPTVAGVESRKPDTFDALQIRAEVHHQDTQRVGTYPLLAEHANMIRIPRPSITGRFANAVPLAARYSNDWQDRYRDRRPQRVVPWGATAALHRTFNAHFGVGAPIIVGADAWWQDAMRPPPGTSNWTIVIPGEEPCYVPPHGDLVHLLFERAPGDTHLLFFCPGKEPSEPPATVVVPIRRAYIVINEVSLRRVDGDIALPTTEMALTIDVDSWTWGFSASLPASSFADIEPASDGTPAELEATINGTTYRVLAEKIARDRSFGRDNLRVTGRGKSALLDAPYAPILNFGNDIARTAQQLMNDVLMLNGVSIGWAVDWNLTDWLVPAGVFAHQGAYIGALNVIAGAAGGYVQPHPTLQTVRVLARYPSLPWDWASLTPDFELPSAVTTREAIEWRDKAKYNRVYVSGVNAGVLGRVTRAGTAGDLVAPMVTDALITHADAARQRGGRVLADTGRQAHVTLRAPVLPETGIIVPGKFVRYVDGATTRMGLVRSTQVDVRFPDVFQNIGVETHVS